MIYSQLLRYEDCRWRQLDFLVMSIFCSSWPANIYIFYIHFQSFERIVRRVKLYIHMKSRVLLFRMEGLETGGDLKYSGGDIYVNFFPVQIKTIGHKQVYLYFLLQLRRSAPLTYLAWDPNMSRRKKEEGSSSILEITSKASEKKFFHLQD